MWVCSFSLLIRHYVHRQYKNHFALLCYFASHRMLLISGTLRHTVVIIHWLCRKSSEITRPYMHPCGDYTSSPLTSALTATLQHGTTRKGSNLNHTTPIHSLLRAANTFRAGMDHKLILIHAIITVILPSSRIRSRSQPAGAVEACWSKGLVGRRLSWLGQSCCVLHAARLHSHFNCRNCRYLRFGN